jgi:pimeloyl-ACP methyl ester carboxylesterase
MPDNNHLSSRVQVNGIDVLIEGSGEKTLVFLHGWPDSERLWDATVAGLKDQFRCVRFTLAGFDLSKGALTPSLGQITASIKDIVEAVSAQQPVTLVLHDWGCTFGYEFSARHPAMVERVVAVDIGNHNHGAYLRSLTAQQKLAMFLYQYWLALSWATGRYVNQSLANWMTRRCARAVKCPATDADLHWQKNYPYAMLWLGLSGGLKGCVRVNPKSPFLYIYGKRKPFMFHSPQWLLEQAAVPGNKVQAFATGHWVMLQQPVEFVACLRDWLSSSQSLVSSSASSR